MNKKLILIAAFIPILLTTGCWDSLDINERAITIAAGVDYKDDLIEFSGEIVKLTKEEENNKASGVYTVHATGKNFEETRASYNYNLPYPAFLGATRVVVFGHSYAELGIEPYINRVDSLYDFRKTLLPVISREPPKDLFNIKTDKDISSGFVIDNILNHLAENGLAICPSIGDLLSDIAFGSIGYVIPYIGHESGEIKYLGQGVFKESKLIGFIDAKETQPFLYLLAHHPKLVEHIAHPLDVKNNYAFSIAIKQRKISTAIENENVVISINLHLNAELQYQYHINTITDNIIKALEQELSTKITNDIYDMIKKAQKEFECDFFAFGKKFRAQHYGYYKSIDWEKAFLTAKIKVNVKAKIVNKNLKSS